MAKKVIDNKVYEDTIELMGHRVSFFFRGEHEITDDMKSDLKEEAESRARACIADDYLSGELNAYLNGFDGMPEDMEFTGWWHIVK